MLGCVARMLGCMIVALTAGAAAAWAAEKAGDTPRGPSDAVWPESLAWARAAPQFYVAPDGKPDAPGTREAPWDVVSAMTGKQKVPAGSVVWLRRGAYTGLFECKLRGTAGAPIIVRACPGERATIDCKVDPAPQSPGTFLASGVHVWYWGFELTNSSPTPQGGIEPKYGGPQRYINLVVHDLGFSSSIGNKAEVYGGVYYNYGRDGSTGYPFYCQNNDLESPFRVTDCIFCNNFSWAIHAYAERGYVRGMEFVGNVWFNSGAAQTKLGMLKDNLLVGPRSPAEAIVLKENMGWAKPPTTRSVALGRYCEKPKDITLIGNYFVGDTQFTNAWEKMSMTGNTFCPAPTGAIDLAQYPDNTYVKDRPAKNVVFVRPNRYEPGRGNVVVYNWEGLDAVGVDVSGVVRKGDRFEVRNGQNFYAEPVVSGVYGGGEVTVPQVGLQPAQPVRAGKIEAEEQTGKEFNVFVVLSGAGCLEGGKQE